MAKDVRKTQQRVARILARTAVKIAREEIRDHSRTLEKALKVELLPNGMARLVIPHYWAVYVNDGRNSFTSTNGWLIYYRNPAQDPRFNGRQTPARANQIGHLTRNQVNRARAMNRAALKRGVSYRDLPVKFIRFPRRVKGVAAKRFFENDGGMRRFIIEYPPLAKAEVEKAFRAFLKPIFRPGVTEKRTLKLRVRRGRR